MIDDSNNIKRCFKRIRLLEILCVGIIFVLMIRVGYLQICEGEYYKKLSDENRIRTIPIMAPRGTFYDRNGEILVTNRPGFSVSLLPLKDSIPPMVIKRIAKLLNMSTEEVNQKIAIHSGFEPIRLQSDVRPDIVSIIEERRDLYPNVVVDVQPLRSYVLNQGCAHALGYVGEISDIELESKKFEGYRMGDIIGKYGLERIYDKEVRGIDGGEQVEVDVLGRPIQVLGKKLPTPGYDLVLTIDKDLQIATENAIDAMLAQLQCTAASVVVLNPKNGEVLAMVSRPSFDPNLFVHGISSEDWEAINNNPDNPMDNKAITGEYPPGSTFKIVTGTAALAAEKVSPGEMILDTGQHWLVPKGNAGGFALGWVDFHDALTYSDNVYFYEMGNRLGIDLLEDYSKMFGLGQTTGIDLPYESPGFFGGRKYKMEAYNEEWYLAETMDVAIGQGFNLLTPLQSAMVLGEVATNGKCFRPHIVKKIMTQDKEIIKEIQPELIRELEIEPWVFETVKAGLRDVAKVGTAARSFGDFPIEVAGKTGTAETGRGVDHGWFVGYEPFDNPNISVAVIVEKGGFGSIAAAPIGRQIMEAALNLKNNN